MTGRVVSIHSNSSHDDGWGCFNGAMSKARANENGVCSAVWHNLSDQQHCDEIKAVFKALADDVFTRQSSMFRLMPQAQKTRIYDKLGLTNNQRGYAAVFGANVWGNVMFYQPDTSNVDMHIAAASARWIQEEEANNHAPYAMARSLGYSPLVSYVVAHFTTVPSMVHTRGEYQADDLRCYSRSDQRLITPSRPVPNLTRQLMCLYPGLRTAFLSDHAITHSQRFYLNYMTTHSPKDILECEKIVQRFINRYKKQQMWEHRTSDGSRHAGRRPLGFRALCNCVSRMLQQLDAVNSRWTEYSGHRSWTIAPYLMNDVPSQVVAPPAPPTDSHGTVRVGATRWTGTGGVEVFDGRQWQQVVNTGAAA